MVVLDKLSLAAYRSPFFLGFAACISVVAISNGALADQTDDDRARAEELFNEGREAVKAEDYKTACPKFEESLKLARRAGTLFNLAQCEEHEGRLVTAVQYYKEGIVVLEPGDPRLAPSKKQLQTIEPRVPYLTVKVEAPLPKGGRVTLDGREIAALDVEFAVNPGKHELRVLAPKYADGVMEFLMAETAHETKTIAIGARLPEPPPVTINAMTPKRIGTIAAFGVGGLGFLTAMITGGLTISANSRMVDGCPERVCATADGYQAVKTGNTLLVANSIAWGVTLAGAGTGVFLLLYKNKKEATPPKSAHSFVFGPGYVGVEGSF